jgi:hypothetical protein
MDLKETIGWSEDTLQKLIEHAGFEEKASMLHLGADKLADPG